MLPFVTPTELLERGELYRQLGATLSAGISILQALELQRTRPIARAFVAPLTKLEGRLRSGDTLASGLLALDPWMPAFDRALLEAGETSGRLDRTLRLLGSQYLERARVARRVISSALYPLLVVHVAVIVFPTSLLASVFWQGEWLPFLGHKAAVFGALYGVVFAVAWAYQGRRGERWREAVEILLGAVPLLGSARHALALSRLSAALEALLAAGIRIRRAWEIAAEASGSVAVKEAVARWRERLAGGSELPSTLLRETPLFPGLFTGLYHSGEISGKLDETLGRLHEHFDEEGSRKLADFARWAPAFASAIVVVSVAFQIASFYAGFFTGERGF